MWRTYNASRIYIWLVSVMWLLSFGTVKHYITSSETIVTWSLLYFVMYYPRQCLSHILCTSTVDAALFPNEWHSSGTLSNAVLQCIIAANKLRIDLCFYKNTSGGNHHIGNKLMLIWSWGQSSQMPGEFYLFIFFFLLEASQRCNRSWCRAFCSLR